MLDTRYAECYLQLRARWRGDPEFGELEALVAGDPSVRAALAALDAAPASAVARASVLAALTDLDATDPERATLAAARIDLLWRTAGTGAADRRSRLRTLDEDLAAGRISAAEYRSRVPGRTTGALSPSGDQAGGGAGDSAHWDDDDEQAGSDDASWGGAGGPSDGGQVGAPSGQGGAEGPGRPSGEGIQGGAADPAVWPSGGPGAGDVPADRGSEGDGAGSAPWWPGGEGGQTGVGRAPSGGESPGGAAGSSGGYGGQTGAGSTPPSAENQSGAASPVGRPPGGYGQAGAGNTPSGWGNQGSAGTGGDPPARRRPRIRQARRPAPAPANGGAPKRRPARARPGTAPDRADVDTRLGASGTSHRLSPAGDPAPEGDVEPAPPSHPRHLVAALPSRAALGTEISLLVRVATDPGPWSASVLLDRLAGATAISLLVQPSTGLVPIGAPEQLLTVPPHGESEPIRFVFRTEQPGLHGVRLMAFAGGTFLAELETQVSVEPGGPAGQPEWARSGPLDVRARRGEVTLQVRSLGGQTVFQLLSDAYLFEPVLAQGAAGDASAAIERAITTLKQLAQGRGPYTGSMARRWMAETGVGLWQALVPHVLQDQFWQIREHISAFSIATDFDVVPWELLYPLRPGADDGFLVEQFPVLRRVFGQARNARLAVTPCTYVTSEPAPTDAQEEVNALRRVLGPGASLGDLGALLDLIAAGPRGGLHFACHNTFTPEDGASVAMRGGPFVPGLLNSAAVRQSLAGHRPLVFLNACRTAGNALEFSRMIGWAQQFMAAGAGAFVGTLWPVRSRSARVFAETFYGSLQDGATLGNALGWARRAAVHDDPDPSWLAYTAYGDPEATAFPPA